MQLRYDKRPTGSRGRSLVVNVPEFGLLTEDRLEATPSCPDVGPVLDDLSAVDRRLRFWRRSSETLTRRRNPIFNKETWIEPDKVFVPDWLHCLSLGCYKDLVCRVWHTLFEWNVIDVDKREQTTHPAFITVNVHILKELLFGWYEKAKQVVRMRRCNA